MRVLTSGSMRRLKQVEWNISFLGHFFFPLESISSSDFLELVSLFCEYLRLSYIIFFFFIVFLDRVYFSPDFFLLL